MIDSVNGQGGGVNGFHRGALSLQDCDSEGRGFQHESVVAPVSDRDHRFRPQSVKVVQLRLRLLCGPDDSKCDRQSGELLKGLAIGVCGENVDLIGAGEFDDVCCDPQLQKPVECEGSVVIHDEMTELEVLESRDGENGHRKKGVWSSGAGAHKGLGDVIERDPADVPALVFDDGGDFPMGQKLGEEVGE